MTPTEKRDATVRLAREVMKWAITSTWEQECEAAGEVCPRLFTVYDPPMLHSSFSHCQSFAPFDSWNDAGMLVKALGLRGRNLRLTAYCYGRTYATFLTEQEIVRIGAASWSESNEPDATAEAISLAAMIALAVMASAGEVHP